MIDHQREIADLQNQDAKLKNKISELHKRRKVLKDRIDLLRTKSELQPLIGQEIIQTSSRKNFPRRVKLLKINRTKALCGVNGETWNIPLHLLVAPENWGGFYSVIS